MQASATSRPGLPVIRNPLLVRVPYRYDRPQIKIKSWGCSSLPWLLAAGWLAGLLSLPLAQRSREASKGWRAITWVKIQKCRNEESSRKVPRNAGEARGPSTGWPRAMGVKIKLKSDCCSFRSMILLIQIVIKSQLQKSDLKVLQVYF